MRIFSFGSDARFELYSITIENLDRDLKEIYMDSPYGVEVIYQRNEGEDIPIGKPLPLIGNVRPCLPYDPIFFLFDDFRKSQWRWKFDYDKQVKKGSINQPITKHVYDPDSDSCATICYELISEGVDAKLKLHYVDHDESRILRITEGEIWAKTEGNSCSIRVLRSFGVSETSIFKKETRWLRNGNEEEIYHHGRIILDRSELGVPAKSLLEVTVNLKYYFVPFEHKEKSTGEICKTYILNAPSEDGKNLLEIHLNAGSVCGPKLLLEVEWSDDLASKQMDKVSMALAEFPYLCSTIEVESDRGQSSSKQPTRNVSDILASPKLVSSPAALSSPFTPENLKSPFSVSFEPTTIAPDQYSAAHKPNPLNQSYEPTERVSDIETPIDTGDSVNQAVVGNEMGEGELIHNRMLGDVILERKSLGRDEVSPPLGQHMPKKQRLEDKSWEYEL